MAMTGSLVSNLEDEFEDQDEEMENLEDEAMEGDSDMVSFFGTFRFVHDLQPVVRPDITTMGWLGVKHQVTYCPHWSAHDDLSSSLCEMVEA